MSQKERKRLTVMQEIKQKKLTLVEAAAVLGLGYRQVRRVWQSYRQDGDKGLVHRGRGLPGKRCKPAKLRVRILARYAARYPDFGPTLAAEYLATEGMVVDHETLRRWLLRAGKRTVRRRRQRHRQWRERKPCLGAMVQLDGSHHDWFEGRRARCVLMVMVDDATNRVWAQFFEEETTHASYEMLAGWTRRQGLPQSLYVDRDSIYRCEGVGSVAEQLAGQQPQTQFGRAMKQLGVELILANSPQAKGRVERMNGVLQDRLVKALRLAGLSDLKGANEFLAKGYLPAFNRKFQVSAASAADVHQNAPPKLAEILSWEVQRVVQRDWTVASGGKWYQLDRQHEALSLAGKKVIVRTLRDGQIQLERGGAKLRWRELGQRPEHAKVRAAGPEKKADPWKPASAHPWRRQRIGRGTLTRTTTPALGGLRSASATLRPPSVPQGQVKQTETTTKGTLSPELLRGHF
jgi:hypothetical protein